ncbi:MAG: bifunctional aspartate kinase/homoserine dehydrogenase I [Bacteroidetes bacterium GWE2_41_25]|nr:MAG: bifunctional aspartate kinase/homoserine dehydrogenase I [Bacteroidetes bacterium GWA2_40_15]OFX96754.1 MAG: bifunctional aspartate kinase/homoserine dehydrogenase I [Bacteroidetes bacterium GWC2_40_22]OFY12274.1 MAG: bifunctional aspartate kinase/homoserine dehydrogenase I [Bacteroidetes bacterium GWE2_41_25]OFY60690.1 MAG: bifunctional aspartate kinase/homoserine dehydrogenase I [Bacteroidetes bacterium GWF2_41_9]HAM09136.1 bifunctional aspartate kinase/homoserine dehydrogenase I [Bac
MKVLKFGGTSVGSPERIRGVKKIIESQSSDCVVVVSAFQGITDELMQISELASARNQEFRARLDKITDRHIDYAKQLISSRKLNSVQDALKKIFDELEATVNGIYLLKELSRHSLDQVLSAGEMLSSTIISNHITGSLLIDSRKIIRTDSNFGFAAVDFEITGKLIKKHIPKGRKHIIIPGFIASNNRNETTTLGRGGSDYTASIVAAALDAEVLEIWTDVDGFMTADPKKVEKAYAIESLTYSEAIELSHFGARVIYTPTLRPVYKKNIPILVLNTFKPELKGTLITSKSSNGNKSLIKGISSIDHIDLITIQGTGMVGVTGTSMRLFSALAGKNINIILITQASSEYSISFAVTPVDTVAAAEAIENEFSIEIKINKEINVQIEKNLSIIAIVGEKMKNTPGISATLFRSLGRNGINVIATAQGSSELNISVVIKNDNLKKALNVIHDGFFLSRYKEMYLFVAGTGLVGTSLLKQLKDQAPTLLGEHNLKVNLMGVTNTRKMIIDKKCVSLDNYKEALKTSSDKGDIAGFISHMTRLNLRNSVFIDCTADEDVASRYKDILSKYVSVVTANKIACSSEYSYYQKLRNIAAERGVRFIYETTVGAGLPIIKTINDLIVSGDRVLKIEAVLSGTMNFIFNELGPDMPLSTAIKKAREKGYSEPDPRVDLSGTDVVRKILILAREAGYPLEKEDVVVTKFLPDDCFKGDLNSFFEKVKKYDREFEQKRKELAARNMKWRFFATLDNGKARVELLTIGADHPSYNLEGSNNIILFTTTRYKELPMVIKGYGAGAEVTAAGVFADLMRVVNV